MSKNLRLTISIDVGLSITFIYRYFRLLHPSKNVWHLKIPILSRQLFLVNPQNL